jgi:hypothetical protein
MLGCMTTSISDLGSHPHQPVFWLRSIKHQSLSEWHHPSSTMTKGLCALIRSLVLLLADLFGSSFTTQPNQSPTSLRRFVSTFSVCLFILVSVLPRFTPPWLSFFR